MTNFAHIGAPALPGKHNMASDAFQALRSTQASGGTPKSSMSFSDLIDTINPLQHIPLVSSLYRELTGDTISNQARMAGGALYGGPIGFVASMIDSAVDLVTGEDLGSHLFAGLFGDDKASPSTETTKLAIAVPTVAPSEPLITGSIATNLPAKPMGAAILQATTPKAQVTASINPAGSTGLTNPSMPPQPLPQLSPEAFNALIGSFADPQAAKKANAGLAANVAKTAEQNADNTKLASATQPAVVQPTATGMPQDLASKIQSGLNQLDALKAANAKSLSLNAVAETGALRGGY